MADVEKTHEIILKDLQGFLKKVFSVRTSLEQYAICYNSITLYKGCFEMKDDPVLSKHEVMHRTILHDLFYFIYDNLNISAGDSGLTEAMITFKVVNIDILWMCEMHGSNLALYKKEDTEDIEVEVLEVPLADPVYREKVLKKIAEYL